MNKKNIEIKRIPSLFPYMIASGVYVIGCLILPMYRLYSYIILIALAVVVYILLRKLNVFQDEVIEIEKPIVYESSEMEELVQQASYQIQTLESLVQSIEHQEMVKDVQGIINTSQAVLNYVEDNQGSLKKVRKYFHYYLEEIVKIVKQYDEFEEETFDVEHVKVSKDKIEKTIHNANLSFLKFYNDLYEGKAMDVSVDLKVFDSMLKRLD